MLIIRHLGLQSYQRVWDDMKHFTATRTETTPDELWLLEHYPVFTQGQAGKPEHLLDAGAIPVINSDRGGQITYHGPGQLVAYVLLDIKRRRLGIRTLVSRIEKTLINVLNQYGILATTQCGAPGVYVQHQKIASIGLRVKNGCTTHGLALNVAMDLSPFSRINPCGYARLEMTQMQDTVSTIQTQMVIPRLIQELLHSLDTSPSLIACSSAEGV